jgi:hypothetical protein
MPFMRYGFKEVLQPPDSEIKACLIGEEGTSALYDFLNPICAALSVHPGLGTSCSSGF